MIYRTLGRTGLRVSEIGFGAWGIGQTSWIGADDTTSVRSLSAARDAGVNFFDTALAYGRGHSERLISRTFGTSPELVVATKAPPKNMQWPARSGVPLRDAYPKQHVLQCLETSLANLKRDTIDLYQFHVWSDEWAGDPEWHSTVEEIRRSGSVRFVGISINEHQPKNVLKALSTGLVDTVQVIYNIFDQSPEDKLFPFCVENQIGVIARVPFDEGSLTGGIRPGTSFPAGDFRNFYFAGNRKRQVWNRIQRLLRELDITADELPELALRFCLSHPAVSSVIPGMRTADHVIANVAASGKRSLSEDVLDSLHRHRWIRNFYAPSPLQWIKKAVMRVVQSGK
jgi:aryl-alcohol dehydrogenase-like predicted oxidoreductase